MLHSNDKDYTMTEFNEFLIIDKMYKIFYKELIKNKHHKIDKVSAIVYTIFLKQKVQLRMVNNERIKAYNRFRKLYS